MAVGMHRRGSSVVTAEYIDKVDEFVMEATYQAELERLREEGCSDPEVYVHRVHTRACYEEIRDHEVVGDVLRQLEALSGIRLPRRRA